MRTPKGSRSDRGNLVAEPDWPCGYCLAIEGLLALAALPQDRPERWGVVLDTGG